MDLPSAERVLLNLPPDDPVAEAVRLLLADRDAWKRQAERMEDVFREAVRAAPQAAGRRVTGSGA